MLDLSRFVVSAAPPAERFPCLRPFRVSEWVGILEVNMDKRDDAIRVLITDPVLQKRLAKYLVHRCFRNSVLEDLHAGIAPDSKAGDYSDVFVSIYTLRGNSLA